MTLSDLSAYIQAYLETNDPKVIGQIPRFIELGAARIGTKLRGAVMERTAPIAIAASQPVPEDFIASRSLTVGGQVYRWVTPDQFAVAQARVTDVATLFVPGELSGVFTIAGRVLSMLPTPSAAPTWVYTALNTVEPSELAQFVPHLIVHAAMAEATGFDGDLESQEIENGKFKDMLADAMGWNFNGSMSLGGLRYGS